MTLTQLQKDIQIYSFNEGQITLIGNVLSTNYKDLEELLMMLKVWNSKLEKDNGIIDTKYEEGIHIRSLKK
jgi:hypothetical protein